MRSRRQDAEILTACVLGDDVALRRLVPGASPDGLVYLAVEHRVAPLAYSCVRALDGVEPDLLRLLGCCGATRPDRPHRFVSNEAMGQRLSTTQFQHHIELARHNLGRAPSLPLRKLLSHA